ncbi:MAG TPA: hypothetical protein VGV88_12485 [Candidatus Dormibacteraeota bacterium]|nr:hypothetical protein [Candidatus Dormibacteraeota bacterium]
MTTAFGLLALPTACGGALFGSVPSPSPVTADSVSAAFDNSTMTNGHFLVTGTIGVQDTHYPVTGDGVLQKSPAFALKLDLTVQGNSGATLVIHEVLVGGKDYTRVGNGKWSSTPDTSSSSPTTATKYVGEETIGGTLTWHAQSADHATGGGNTYDIWVRETDGYVVFLQYTSPSSVLTMRFDTYNQSPAITAP